MRILLHSPPPWAPSGYGTQCAIAARVLKGLGHEVGLSVYGYHGREEWEGMPLYPVGNKQRGNGLVAYNCRRHQAELLITLGDVFLLDPAQFSGLHVMPWVMIDCDPMGIMDASWLAAVDKVAASCRPLAACEFGQRMLAGGRAGWCWPGAGMVPMVAAPEYRPDAAAGQAWRREMGIGDDMFVISKVGVNNEDDRKSFGVTLQAFAMLARRRKDACLYLHCEAQTEKCPNLVMMATELGLKGRVAFPVEERRAADGYDAGWMRGMFCGSSLYDATSKGEGFGVPVVEALACGTPVTGSVGSAVAEKIAPEHGWMIGGQKFWARHHQAWWREPSVEELFRVYQRAANTAKSMRHDAAAAGQAWRPEAMAAAWEAVLT